MFLNASLCARGILCKKRQPTESQKRQTEILFIFNMLVGLGTIQGNLYNDSRIFAYVNRFTQNK